MPFGVLQSFVILHKSKKYLIIGAFSFKFTRISSVMSMDRSLWPFMLYLVFLERFSIGCLSIERKIVWLISIMGFTMVFLGFFCFEGCSVGSRTIESRRVRSILSIAMSFSFYLDLVGDIAFIVFCLIIKLGIIGMIGISRFKLDWFWWLSFIGFSICRL